MCRRPHRLCGGDLRRNAAAFLSEKQKGDLFERLIPLSADQADIQDRTERRLAREIGSAADVRKQLNLPLADEGIDLIAQARDGKFWAIQAKFKSDPERAPTYKELSTFSSLARPR